PSGAPVLHGSAGSLCEGKIRRGLGARDLECERGYVGARGGRDGQGRHCERLTSTGGFLDPRGDLHPGAVRRCRCDARGNHPPDRRSVGLRHAGREREAVRAGAPFDGGVLRPLRLGLAQSRRDGVAKADAVTGINEGRRTYSRRVAKFLISKMPFPVLYETFYQSARALGIRSYEITGSTGAFFGPTYDQSVTKSYLRTGSWSTNLVGLFQHFFEQAGGGTFYDIGGNIGLVTVPVSRDPKVRCVVFEPDPHNCMLLRANVAINSGGSNVEIVNAAVAAEKGELGLVRSDYNSGDHYLSDHGEIRVPVVRLDDYPAAPGPFAVKIDTQGAEPA